MLPLSRQFFIVPYLHDIVPTAGREWDTAQAFEQAVVGSSGLVDLALVCACRSLVARYLTANAHKDVNGIALGDAILALYTDIRSVIFIAAFATIMMMVLW